MSKTQPGPTPSRLSKRIIPIESQAATLQQADGKNIRGARCGYSSSEQYLHTDSILGTTQSLTYPHQGFWKGEKILSDTAHTIKNAKRNSGNQQTSLGTFLNVSLRWRVLLMYFSSLLFWLGGSGLLLLSAKELQICPPVIEAVPAVWLLVRTDQF